MICGDMITVLDGDTHCAAGETPSIKIVEMLRETEPSLFDGCIEETTASLGSHTYYSGIKNHGNGYKIPFDLAELEVLTGKSLCYCWPSCTEKGMYQITSKRNFLNTKVDELPEFPARFTDAYKKVEKIVIEEQPPEVRKAKLMQLKGELTAADFDCIVEYYLHHDFDKSRNVGALKLSRCLWGLESYGYPVSLYDVERWVKGIHHQSRPVPH